MSAGAPIDPHGAEEAPPATDDLHRGRAVAAIVAGAVVTVVAVVVAVLAASALTRSDGTTYEGHDLSFRYPTTWHVQELPETDRSPGTDFELFIAPGLSITSGVLLGGSSIEPAASEEASVASLVQSATEGNAFLDSIGDVVVVAPPARHDVNGYVAVSTTITLSGAAGTSTLRRVAIVVADRRIDISCAIEEADLEAVTPGCEQVLDTLSVG